MRRRQNASSGAPNSSGRRSRQRSSKKTESSDANATGFAKSGRMKTAKAEMDSRRQASEALASREYFGDAPDDPSLIHVSAFDGTVDSTLRNLADAHNIG